MVTCPNCGHQGQTEKFCSNCGTPLEHLHQAQAQGYQSPPPQSYEAPPQQTSRASNGGAKFDTQGFGNYILQSLKQPSSAKSVTEKDFVSGLITIGVFALIFALFNYLEILGYYDGAPFFDFFLKPFFVELLELIAIPALIFGAFMVLKESVSFQQVVAKFGAYLVPFIALFIVAGIIGLLDISVLYYMTYTISTSGVFLIIPVLILFEKNSKPSNGLDRIYIVFLVILAFLLVSYLLGNITTSAPTQNINIDYNDLLEDLF